MCGRHSLPLDCCRGHQYMCLRGGRRLSKLESCKAPRGELTWNPCCLFEGLSANAARSRDARKPSVIVCRGILIQFFFCLRYEYILTVKYLIFIYAFHHGRSRTRPTITLLERQ